MIKARIRRLSLDHFRTYRAASLTVSGEGPIVLFGPNGAGKTNILESISFLTTGRGLRRATLDEVAFNEGDGSWAVAADLEGALGLATLGTGILAPFADETTRTRLFRIDREPVSSAQAFAEHVAILWLTPSMDGLFSGAASERRRFFDRLVLATDGSHQARVNALERGLRSRNRLLEAHHPDPLWLDAIERELAEIGVAVAAARAETATRIKPLLAARKATSSAFPWARMTLDGELENAIGSMPSIAIEDAYRARLKQNRARDAAAGRTLIGPHLTDLIVHHGPTGMNAASASTGEQKALLIGFVLAQAELIAGMTGCTPILLLDEIGAHLDSQRRLALFAELDALGAQSWMTGADPDLFKGIGPAAQAFEVQLGAAKLVTGRL